MQGFELKGRGLFFITTLILFCFIYSVPVLATDTDIDIVTDGLRDRDKNSLAYSDLFDMDIFSEKSALKNQQVADNRQIKIDNTVKELDFELNKPEELEVQVQKAVETLPIFHSAVSMEQQQIENNDVARILPMILFFAICIVGSFFAARLWLSHKGRKKG